MGGRNDRRPPVRGRSLTRCVLALLTFVLLNFSVAGAQVLQVGGGSSTLFQASGGSIGIRAANYEGVLGAGILDGQWYLGALFRRQWGKTTFAFGDDVIPLQLPTDEFNPGYHFLGRGASVTIKRGGTTVFGFAGATSRGFGATFFQGARAEDAAAALFLDRKLSPKLRFFSRNLFAVRATSISGLEWLPLPRLKTAFSAGIGANQRYFGSSVDFERRWFSFKAVYVAAGDQFRRVIIDQPVSAENIRENLLVSFHPTRFFDLSAGRFNLLQQVDLVHPPLRALVDQYSASLYASGWKLNANFFASKTATTAVTGTSFGLDRTVTRWLQASSGVFHSNAEKSPGSTSLIAMIREVFSARFSLLQEISHTAGQNSMAWGGDFLSNPLSIGVSYQTVFSPFFPGRPFRQVMLLNVSFRPGGNLQLNTSTYVSPLGTVKYAAYGTAFAYRSGDGPPAAAVAYRFPRYRILGQVRDESGQPVAGAAVRIEREMVFSNSNGEFFLRRKKGRPCRIEVMLQEFLVPGRFEVVSAPVQVDPSPENPDNFENQATIVLRRRTVTAPSLGGSN